MSEVEPETRGAVFDASRQPAQDATDAETREATEG
jgi:hypothetical protein